MNGKWLNAEWGGGAYRIAAYLRRGIARIVIALALSLLPGTAVAQTDTELFEAVRAADLAVARIGYRLTTANAPLCDRLEPGLGLVLHTPEQYAPALRAEAGKHFRLDAPIGVEAVIAGSPADRAGIRADDALTAVGPVPFAPEDPASKATTSALIAATRLVIAQPPGQSLTVKGRRDGVPYARTVEPIPACRTRFEVVIESAFSALADGEMVQISSRFLEEYSEDLIAAVLAHELAHNILRHRERLEERGVSFGMLSGLGRNVRYFRQTEIEADVLSVALLANAGYDPQVAVRFWHGFGPRGATGILRSRSHPAWRDRVAVIERTIAGLGPERPVRPALLDSRDRVLDGNWQQYLARAR